MQTLTHFYHCNKTVTRESESHVRKNACAYGIHTHTNTHTHMCCWCSRSDFFSHSLSISFVRSQFSSQSSNIDLTIPSHFKTSSVFYVRSMRTVLNKIFVQVPTFFSLKKRQQKNSNKLCVYYYYCTICGRIFFTLFFFLSVSLDHLESFTKEKRRKKEEEINKV